MWFRVGRLYRYIISTSVVLQSESCVSFLRFLLNERYFILELKWNCFYNSLNILWNLLKQEVLLLVSASFLFQRFNMFSASGPQHVLKPGDDGDMMVNHDLMVFTVPVVQLSRRWYHVFLFFALARQRSCLDVVTHFKLIYNVCRYGVHTVRSYYKMCGAHVCVRERDMSTRRTMVKRNIPW